MLRRTLLSAVPAIAVVPAAAMAQGAAQQRPARGPNGCRVVVADGHPVEFVASGAELTFFLRDDDGTPLATRGVSARAVVQQGGQTTTVQLAPAAPNRLVGRLEAPLAPNSRVVFSASLHGHRLQARFVTD
jgi:hypothetical protein